MLFGEISLYSENNPNMKDINTLFVQNTVIVYGKAVWSTGCSNRCALTGMCSETDQGAVSVM